MPGEAFPASRRIRKRSEFQRIQRSGRAFRTPHYVMLVEAQPGAPDDVPSRLGIVATKKLGHSPARNRAKRVCREVFRKSGDLVPPGFDLVVLMRADAHRIDFDQAKSEWETVRRAIRRHCEEARITARKALAAPVPVESGPGRPHVAPTSQPPKRGARGGSTP